MQNKTFPSYIIGQNIIRLKRVTSTNDFIKESLANFKPLAAGTAILADDQFAGRGQLDNKWLSKPGQNITTSVYLEFSNLIVSHQFYLSMSIALAVRDFIQSYVSKAVKIKWPNDIYVDNAKIAGILIENKLKGQFIISSIVGIGINVKQTVFENSNVSTSLKLLLPENNFVIEESAKILYQYLDKYHQLLMHQNYSVLEKEYNAHQFWRYQEKSFEIAGNECIGKITGVNAQGQLIVDIDHTLHSFNHKEIKYLL